MALGLAGPDLLGRRYSAGRRLLGQAAGLHGRHRGGMLWLVLVGALASVVSLGYYLRLVWAMFMKPAGEPLDKTDMSVAA